MQLLSDPIALRRSIVLPEYVADTILPWIYGRVTLAPVRLDAAGYEWLVADHPIVGVSRVLVGGLAVAGWQLIQTLDATGHAISKIRLTTAPKSGESVAVSVIGRRHAQTGAVLEHPADIVESLLEEHGWTVSADAFRVLRERFPGLSLGGVFDRATTLRAAVTTVLASVDAEWSAAPLLAWLSSQPAAPLWTATPALVDEASAESTHEDLATRLAVSFAQDWAAGAPAFSLLVAAPERIAEVGVLEATLDLPWVRTARDALAIASQILQRRARPSWTITLSVGDGGGLLPGDAVTLAHPWIPRGVATISRIARSADRYTITLILAAGSAPRIELVSRGERVETAGVDPLRVVYQDGVAAFTILNDLGDPLAGASVSLDGAETRTTDRLGQVQFTTTRGTHTLLVVAAGYAPFEMEVVV